MMNMNEIGLNNYTIQHYKNEHKQNEEVNTLSLADLKIKVNWLVENALLNNMDIEEVPIFATIGDENYVMDSFAVAFGSMTNDNICGNIHVRLLNKIVPKDTLITKYIEAEQISGDYLHCQVNNSEDAQCILQWVHNIHGDNGKTMSHIWRKFNDGCSVVKFVFSSKDFDIQKLYKQLQSEHIISEDILKSYKR